MVCVSRLKSLCSCNLKLHLKRGKLLLIREKFRNETIPEAMAVIGHKNFSH